MARQEAAPRKQTFHFTAPDANAVLLVGDFTNWQKKAIPMQKGRDGIWRAIVQLTPGTHIYRFIMDGQWCDDPECTERVPNPYGGHDMVRQVV